MTRWVFSFIGMALLAALVWVFGPLLPALEPWLPRLIAIETMLVAWGVINGVLTWRRRSREAALTQGVGGLAMGEEAAAVGERLRTALALLKRSGKRGYLFEKPWYVIIGPPGAGKTTALLNAGLTFPLAEQMGAAALSGVGGTRLCDWWFTEDAVLIDTAGRYTTQDSDAAVDGAGWDAFLALLKRTRPRQPLNGVIVAIALPSVIDAAPGEAAGHATSIMRRIAELETRLAIRMPVYALFTKADLVAGFSEFFDDFDRERRDQVWGVTFPLVANQALAAERFAPAFRGLVKRLTARMSGRLQAERRPDRRGVIAGFPAQVASMETPLTAFLGAAFAGAPGKPPPMLRGVYFASGTQEGTPIDRLTGAMARAFGIDQRKAAAQRPEQGRSYFLGRLLREVMLGEAMLVREAPGAARRRLGVRIAGFAAVLVAALASGAVLLGANAAAQRDIDASARALASYEQAARDVPLDPVSDGDLRHVSALLDQARSLSREGTGPEWLSGLGLWQGAKLTAGERAVYHDGIANGLLPHLVWRLEAQMRGSLNRPGHLYDQTRVYLMLGGAGPLNKDQVRAWMDADWRASYPVEEDASLRAALARHLDAALAEPLPPLSLDGALVARARDALARVPVADRVYATIRTATAAQHVPAWRPLDALGPAGAQIFLRSSGKAMADGIPGFYTAEGYRTVLLPAVEAATKAAAGESWVLGRRTEIGQAELRELSGAIVAGYVADYDRIWDAVLDDLNVRPLLSLVQAAQDLYVLASPESPMRALAASLAHELGGADASIGARYWPLIDAAPNPAGAAIDPALRQLAEVQQTLAKLAALPVGAPIPPGGETIANGLIAEVARQPQPVARWLSTIAASATALRTGNVRGQTSLAFNAPGGPSQTCQALINGRYPFAPPGVQAELSLDDAARLFAPGGSLDGFFNLQLKPFADTTAQPWKPQPSGTIQSPVSAADLQQFQRAATIRDALFVSGQARPALQLDIQPISLDPGATGVTLDLGGTVISYAKGASHATQVVWPGPSDSARVAFDPPAAELAETGPWALFRLFARGRLQPGKERGRYTLIFQSGLRQAAFDVRTGSANSAFAPGLLAGFRCPAVQ